MQRRELFSSLASSFGVKKEDKQENIPRPPYNSNPELFTVKCHECDALCLPVCEEQIIKIGSDKTPYLDFSKNGCTYCEKCADICPLGVLTLAEPANYIDLDFEIDIMKCISWHDVMCMSCKDPCLDRAIEFLGMFRPSIDMSRCTSCGFCIGVCPSDAIVYKPKEKVIE